MKLPVLIDIDGVLRSGDRLLPHVRELFDFLRLHQHPFCLLSNSTKQGKEDLEPYFEQHGIAVDFPIVTALDVTKAYLLAHYSAAKVYAIPSALRKLTVLPDQNPQVLVVGDLGEGFTYATLNEMLRYLLNGAELLAMQQNAIGKNENGHYLDAGSFVAALEYGSGKKAKLLGKPAPSYFDTALQMIGARIGKPFLMLGDDLKVDVQSAMQVGGKGILLLTGKTTEGMLDQQVEGKPDCVANDLLDAIQFISSTHAN